MEHALPAIGEVMGRMASIEARFTTPRADDTMVVAPSPEFDAFGEVYQQALATRAAQPVATTATWMGAPTTVRYTQGVGGVGYRTSSSPTATWTTPQLTSAVTGQAGVPGARAVGGYGTMPVPAELQVYGNGQIPRDRLRPIEQSSNHRLYEPAAISWDALVDAAAEAGFDLDITDSYRSYEEQVGLAQRKGLYSQGGLAATPGTSNHGWGLAVDADVRDPALLAWLRQNGPRFGWVEAVPREPWHWEFRPHQV